jgi:hypothetical protein
VSGSGLRGGPPCSLGHCLLGDSSGLDPSGLELNLRDEPPSGLGLGLRGNPSGLALGLGLRGDPSGLGLGLSLSLGLRGDPSGLGLGLSGNSPSGQNV